MFRVLKILIIMAISYLGYVNFIQGSKAEKIVMQAADVGKQTINLGKDGLNELSNTVKSHIR